MQSFTDLFNLDLILNGADPEGLHYPDSVYVTDEGVDTGIEASPAGTNTISTTIGLLRCLPPFMQSIIVTDGFDVVFADDIKARSWHEFTLFIHRDQITFVAKHLHTNAELVGNMHIQCEADDG